MKIYLDACCWNRPFDDQSQHRVRLEAEAVLSILGMAEAGEFEIAGSDVVEGELSQMPDRERYKKVELLLALASFYIDLTPAIERRARELQNLNFSPWDALQIAAAESVPTDCFLTTDDELLRKANRQRRNLKVKVENPAKWLIQRATDEN